MALFALAVRLIYCSLVVRPSHAFNVLHKKKINRETLKNIGRSGLYVCVQRKVILGWGTQKLIVVHPCESLKDVHVIQCHEDC